MVWRWEFVGEFGVLGALGGIGVFVLCGGVGRNLALGWGVVG